VQDEARMFSQPLAHAFVSVRAIVVENQMQGGRFWKLSIQATYRTGRA
jgi:hypothetical protein